MTFHAKPYAMGVLMFGMMLPMLHGPLMTGGDLSVSLILFALAHLAVALVLIAIAVFGARMSPKVRSLLSKIHRPSRQHFDNMLAGAASTFAVVHFLVHSGAVSWT